MNFFQALLYLCPNSFRAEYGTEMESVFRRRLRDAAPAQRAGLWMAAVADILKAAAGAHWDVFCQDVRQTVRSARRAPGFTCAVIAVAGLGVASATAVFSLADHVLLRALPFPEPEALVKLWQKTPQYARMDVSPANYRDWKSMSRSFASMAAYRSVPVNLSGLGEPERLTGAAVSAGLFGVMGVATHLGRTFSDEEDTTGAPGTVILSHGFWLMRFGGDPTVIGRHVRLDDEPFTIIGVMPPEFRYPQRNVQVWTAMRFREDDFADRGNCFLGVVARLKPGVRVEQARGEMQVVANRLSRAHPDVDDLSAITVIPMRDELSVRSRTTLTVLATSALCVLLIACANLANLFVARSASRRKELQVRTALGAGRERLVRQLITESGLLASAGGCLGTLLALLVVPLLARLAPSGLPIAELPPLDGRVVWFAALLTLLTGIAAGIVPALRTGGTSDLNARGGTGRREGLRRSLVIVQVAASLALVVAAGLLGRALLRVQARDAGFATANRLVFRTSLPLPKYLNREPRERFYTAVLDGIRALPGVRSAAVVSFRPMGDFRGGIWKLVVPGETRNTRAVARFVTPGYFHAMNIPLLRGRDFRPSDKPETERAAIVSQSFVEDHWPGESGLGRTFGIPFGDLWFTIVGVAADVRFRGMEMQSEPQMYFAHSQVPDGTFVWFTPKDFIVASEARPEALLPAIRNIVQRADASQPVSDVQTLTGLVRDETAARRTQLWVIFIFSAAALILSGVGIHSVLAYSIVQRTSEIGVRRAMGAQSSQIASIVLSEALMLTLSGAIVGAIAALWLGRSMQSLLAGVSSADVLTLLISFAVLALMSAAAVAVPLIRALKVDPATMLRTE